MQTLLKLDTDVIQDRIERLQTALQTHTFSQEQMYADLLALSQELLFIAEDLESRRINTIVPGGNVTF